MISKEEAIQEAEKVTCSSCWFRHQGRCIHPDSPISSYIIEDLQECGLMKPRHVEHAGLEPFEEWKTKTCGECAHYRPRRELCIKFRELDEHDEPTCRLFEPRKIKLKHPSLKFAELLASRRYRSPVPFAEKFLERAWVDWDSGDGWVRRDCGIWVAMKSDQILKMVMQKFKLEGIDAQVGAKFLDVIKYVLLTTMHEYHAPVHIKVPEVEYTPPYDKRVKLVHHCGECVFWLNGLCLSAKVRDQLRERPKVGPFTPACDFRRSVLDE